MPFHIGWDEIAWRLILTVSAGALIGLNRTERGRAAGLRTTILVCLAASVSMIQVNLLMPTTGKTPDSFVVFDLMRLPLGILTGMGFIGGGAILRKGEMIQGVTTAATMWLVTVIGLCLGGGQLVLGMVTTGLGMFVLWILKRVEVAMPQDRRGQLTLSMASQGPKEDDVRRALIEDGYRIGSWEVGYELRGDAWHCNVHSEIHWRGRFDETEIPKTLDQFKQHPAVHELRWSSFI